MFGKCVVIRPWRLGRSAISQSAQGYSRVGSYRLGIARVLRSDSKVSTESAEATRSVRGRPGAPENPPISVRITRNNTRLHGKTPGRAESARGVPDCTDSGRKLRGSRGRVPECAKSARELRGLFEITPSFAKRAREARGVWGSRDDIPDCAGSVGSVWGGTPRCSGIAREFRDVCGQSPPARKFGDVRTQGDRRYSRGRG